MTTDKSSKKFLYFAACTGNIAAFTCGICLGWSSPEIPKLKGLEENPLDHPISKTEEGWIGSFLAVGGMIGPLAAGLAVNKIGRKPTLILGNIPFVIAFIINTLASNVYLFFLSRFLTGVSVGIVFTVLPMYIGEISEDEVRGKLGSFMQLFITFGLLFSYSLGPYLSITLFNILCLISPVVFLISFSLFMPESPHYLIQKGKYDAAVNSLIKLREKPKEEIEKEIEIVKTVVEESLANKVSFLSIFKSKGTTRALLLAVVLISLQQFSGINVVLFYAQDIFNDAGVSLAPEICTIILGIVQIISSTCSSALVERKGKRFLLIISSIGMAISLAFLTIFFYLKEDLRSDVSDLAWVPIASLIMFIIMYCLGFGPLPWAMAGELFPNNVKSVANAATAVACWISAFVLTRYFGSVSLIIGTAGGFGFVGVCCVIAGIFVYRFVPETSGKSLQEIQDILNGVSDECDSKKCGEKVEMA